MLLFVGIIVSSCEKSEKPVLDLPETAVSDHKVISDKALIRFLSISINVDSSEITLDTTSNEFLIRGLKFNRDEMRTIYINANVFKSIYGE